MWKSLFTTPQLVPFAPKLLRHQKLLRPHAEVIAANIDALAPHLPRMLDNIDVLGPYLPAMFEVMPSLLPYLGPLLDELALLAPHLPAIVAHRDELLPTLPHMVPQLPLLRPYYGELAIHLDLLAPYASRLAPHLDALVPHMPQLLARLGLFAPQLDIFTQEAALQTLVPHLDLLVGADDKLLREEAGRLSVGNGHGSSSEAPSAEVGAAQLSAMLEKLQAAQDGTDEDVEAAPAAATNPFWGKWKLKLPFFEPKRQPEAPTPEELEAKGAALLANLSGTMDGMNDRLGALEGEFRRFKEQVHWRQQQGTAMAMKLAACEGGMIEVEDEIATLNGSRLQLKDDVTSYAQQIGAEAISRGEERSWLSRSVFGGNEVAKTDTFLWKLAL